MIGFACGSGPADHPTRSGAKAMCEEVRDVGLGVGGEKTDVLYQLATLERPANTR